MSAHEQSEIWQHFKSGGLYTVIGHGMLEANLTPMTIYRSLWDGAVCIRPTEEFEDGRFHNIAVDEVTNCRPEADKSSQRQRQEADMTNKNDCDATIEMILTTDSGYQSSETHRISADQWERILKIANEPSPVFQSN